MHKKVSEYDQETLLTLSNGYEYTCCKQSILLDNNGYMHDFSHNLSSYNVFVLRLITSYGNFA